MDMGFICTPREAELAAFNIDPERKISQKKELDGMVRDFLERGGTILDCPAGVSGYCGGAKVK